MVLTMYGYTDVIATGSAKRHVAKMANCCLGKVGGPLLFLIVAADRGRTESYVHGMLAP